MCVHGTQDPKLFTGSRIVLLPVLSRHSGTHHAAVLGELSWREGSPGRSDMPRKTWGQGGRVTAARTPAAVRDAASLNAGRFFSIGDAALVSCHPRGPHCDAGLRLRPSRASWRRVYNPAEPRGRTAERERAEGLAARCCGRPGPSPGR